MKKKLESELISIAHRILKMKDRSTLPKLQEETRKLYETLTVLNFTESHFSDTQPTIGTVVRAIEAEPEELLSEIKTKEEKVVKTQPIIQLQEPTVEETITESIPDPISTLEENEVKTETTEVQPMLDLGIETIPVQTQEVVTSKTSETEIRPELVIEEINEKVTGDLFVPASEKPQEPLTISEPEFEKNDKEEIGFVSDVQPEVEIQVKKEEEKIVSLNDQLKRGIHIGLNDRLAFIKHLFDGSSTDYNRVLSQLNTLSSKSGARQFISNMVKPDYNDWKGKEEYEKRFMDIVTRKYEF